MRDLRMMRFLLVLAVTAFGGVAGEASAGELRPAALTGLSAAATEADTGTLQAPSLDALLDRVVVLGASASAGFGVRMTTESPEGGPPVAVPLDLASVLEVVLPARSTLRSVSTAFFFASPLATGERQITTALEEEPTLVIAIDYLFWFGYGAAGGSDPADEDGRRLSRLEKGLRELERLGDLPVVLGDLPDMSESVGRMLRPAQMPSEAALKAMNERIRAWAADRPMVRLFPLAELIDRMRDGREITVGSVEWTAEETQRTLQWDRLHPSVDGLIVMAQQAMVCLRPADLDREPAEEASDWMRSVVIDTQAIRRRLAERSLERAVVPAGS